MRACSIGGEVEMIMKATKRMAIALLVILAVAFGAYSPGEALAQPPAVYLNSSNGTESSAGPLVITGSGPVSLPIFIFGGDWTGDQFELSLYTGAPDSKYLDSDGVWQSYDSSNPYAGSNPIRPCISSQGIPGLVLPSYVNLPWTPDSSFLPAEDATLYVCIDDVLDNTLEDPQNSTDSYCGQVDIQHQLSSGCQITVTAEGENLQSNNTLVRQITQGQTAAPAVVDISDSCGGSPFGADVVEGAAKSWLSVNTAGNSVDVTFNTSGLQAQQQPYTGTIRITDNSGAQIIDVPVQVTVSAASACTGTTMLQADPSTVNFSGTLGTVFKTTSVSNSPQNVTIEDCNGNTFSNFTVGSISMDDGGNNWLSAQNVNGALQVSVNGTHIVSTGDHTGTITITAAGYSNLTIPVDVNVTGGGATCDTTAVRLDPSPLSFSGTAGSTTASQTVNVTDGCYTSISFSVTDKPSWVTVTPTSGSGSFSVLVKMPASSQTGNITVAANGKNSTLTVYATPSGPACTLPATPTISDPGTSVGSGASYTVSWQAVSGATGYQICEATDSGFASQTCQTVTTTSYDFSHSNSLCGGVTYYYRVRAENSSCGWGNYSSGSADMTVDGTGQATEAQLKDTSGNVVTQIDQTVSTTYSTPQMTLSDDCGNPITISTATVYSESASGSCSNTSGSAPGWITAVPSGSSLTVNLDSSGLTAGNAYYACVQLTFTDSNLQSVTKLNLPVTLTVQSSPPSNVQILTLTSGVAYVTSPSQPYMTLGANKIQYYKAIQTGTSYFGYSNATMDWTTFMDMIIMYSGPTCGSKLPDMYDYQNILNDIAATGINYRRPINLKSDDGNYYDFYYQFGSQNQSVNVSSGIQTGCYYVFIYNTSDVTGKYQLSWTQR